MHVKYIYMIFSLTYIYIGRMEKTTTVLVGHTPQLHGIEAAAAAKRQRVIFCAQTCDF